MSLQLSAFLTLLVLSLAVPIILFLLLRTSLTDLLRHTLKVEAGITFYLRSFLLILFLSALSAALGTSFYLKPDSRASITNPCEDSPFHKQLYMIKLGEAITILGTRVW